MRKTSDVLWQDAQHQVLFDLLDQVAGESDTATVLDRLHFYAESHFALEETYMRTLDYPGRSEHVAAHDLFRVELTQLRSTPAGADPISDQLIATFLTEWLKRHVFGIDKRLEAFLLDRGVR